MTNYRRIVVFNDTATTEIYTLSLHDALPISSTMPLAGAFSASGRSGNTAGFATGAVMSVAAPREAGPRRRRTWLLRRDRKSTRLNSSHAKISYAGFCLEKKQQHTQRLRTHDG